MGQTINPSAQPIAGLATDTPLVDAATFAPAAVSLVVGSLLLVDINSDQSGSLTIFQGDGVGSPTYDSWGIADPLFALRVVVQVVAPLVTLSFVNNSGSNETILKIRAWTFEGNGPLPHSLDYTSDAAVGCLRVRDPQLQFTTAGIIAAVAGAATDIQGSTGSLAQVNTTLGALSALGATTDAAAGTDSSNTGLIGLFKRLLGRLTTLLNGGLPAALGTGGGLKVDGSGTALPVSGTVGVSGAVDTELTTADLDTGAGTDTRAVIGLALAESGGAQLVGSAHPVPVSGSVTADTELPAAAALADAATNPTTALAGACLLAWNGASWDRVRVSNIVKDLASVTITSITTVWTPASGKKFRLMGGCIALSVAGSVLFEDNSGGNTVFRTPDLLAATPYNFDLGNGVLSAAANNVLKATSSAAGSIRGTLYGVEE